MQGSGLARRAASIACLACIGVLGLVAVDAAVPASSTIQVGSLVVVAGSATGDVSGFDPNATASINGHSYVADGTGKVTLVAAPLGSTSTLTIGITDSTGTAHTVSTALRDLTSGLPLSIGQLVDTVPDTTAPETLLLDVGSGTTTTGTTSTGGASTTTTTTSTTTTVVTTTTGGSGGGSSAGSPPGAVKLADGTLSIPASSVAAPYRLVIKQVKFSPVTVRARNQRVVVAFRVADTRGYWVRNAAVWMRDIPLHHIKPVAAKRTSKTGAVTFTTKTAKKLRLVRGGRINIFVRAWKPGESMIGGISTRRFVSLRMTK